MMSTIKSTVNDNLIPEPDEQTFHSMFDKDPEIMLLIEPETGLIVDANQTAVDFYGYHKSDLRNMAIHEINTLSPQQVAAECQKALHEERNYFVFPHRLASGEERIVEVYSSPIVLRKKHLLFSTIHDITDRKPLESVMWVRSK
jgi:PAS domain S-box-containing protein